MQSIWSHELTGYAYDARVQCLHIISHLTIHQSPGRLTLLDTWHLITLTPFAIAALLIQPKGRCEKTETQLRFAVTEPTIWICWPLVDVNVQNLLWIVSFCYVFYAPTFPRLTMPPTTRMNSIVGSQRHVFSDGLWVLSCLIRSKRASETGLSWRISGAVYAIF